MAETVKKSVLCVENFIAFLLSVSVCFHERVRRLFRVTTDIDDDE